MAVKSGDRGSVISPRFVMKRQLPICYASVSFPDLVATWTPGTAVATLRAECCTTLTAHSGPQQLYEEVLPFLTVCESKRKANQSLVNDLFNA